MTAYSKCDHQLERHRIGRGSNQRDPGVEVDFCPACNSVVEHLHHQPAEGYRPRPRKDLDE